MTKKNEVGFTLIELLLVVSIVSIVASIAVPNLLASRKVAYEAQVISNLRSIASANTVYLATNGGGNSYASSLANLRAAKLLDARWGGTPIINGYTYFYYTGNTNRGFCMKAAFGSSSNFGSHSYSISHLGVIYKLADGLPPACDAVTGSITTGVPL